MSRKTRVKRKAKHQEDIEFLQEVIARNGSAVQDGPKKKRWTRHDVTNVRPLTGNQEQAFTNWFENPEEHLALLGSAGCGKSFIAIYLALTEMFRYPEKYQSLKIVRSVVQTRQIGAIPGTLQEKKQPIFDVYADIFADLFKRSSTFKDMCDAGVVELIDTSYIRGSTWSNCIILVDEVNNMNTHEVDTVMTRVGKETRVIIAGDKKQSDLAVLSNRADKYDHDRLLKVISRIPSIHKVFFTAYDIVRSEFAKQWIISSGDD